MNAVLLGAGRAELAAKVRRFAEQMPPPRTEREWIAKGLLERIADARRVHSAGNEWVPADATRHPSTAEIYPTR